MKRFCPNCGYDTESSPCSHCGEELPPIAGDDSEDQSSGEERHEVLDLDWELLDEPEREQAPGGPAKSEARPRFPVWMRPAAPLIAVLAYGLPALAFIAILSAFAEQGERFRFSLLGLGFRGESDKAFSVTMGPNRDTEDVWVANLPGSRANVEGALGKLEFRPPGTSAVDGQIATGSVSVKVDHQRSDPVGLVAERVDRTYHLLGQAELRESDVLTVDGEPWRLEIVPRLMSRQPVLVPDGGDGLPVPMRRGGVPFFDFKFPVWRPFSVAQRTHPLGVLLSPDQRPAPVASFLYREPSGFFGSRLFVADLDDEIDVIRDGEAVEPQVSRKLSEGARLHALGLPRGSSDFEARGVRDLRSFRVWPGKRSLMFEFDTPEIHSLTWKELDGLKARTSAQETEGQPFVVHLAMGGWRITDEYLYFKNVSQAIATEAFATLTFPEDWTGRFGTIGQPVRLTTPQGQRDVSFGEPFFLGDRHLAAIQLDLLRPPVRLAWLALVMVLFKVVAAVSSRMSGLQLLVAAAVELLVACRLLLAYRTWAAPPHTFETMELALFAWAVLPWFLIVVALPPWQRLARERLPAWLSVFGGWCLSFAWCVQVSGGLLEKKAWVWVVCHALVLAIPVIRSLLATETAAGLMARFNASGSYAQQVTLWCLGALGIGLLRTALVFVGFRESLVLGQRFALSLLHLPAALVLEAGYLVWLWRRMRGQASPRALDFLPALCIVMVTWALPAFAVSDLGLALLNLLPFLLVVGLLAWAAPRGRLAPPVRWSAVALPAVVFLSLAAPFGARLAIDLLPEDTQRRFSTERTYLRVLAFAYPDKLNELGHRPSEDLAIMSSVMKAYTSGKSAIFGRGYMESDISPQLKSTALREHAPAVLVAAEWGLAGVLFLILLYPMLGVAALVMMPWRSWYRSSIPDSSFSTDTAAVLACLSAWTFSLTSVYMILANYGMLLFTGKNAYLLGLDSAADVLESLLLVVAFGVGAAVVRDQEGYV